jgi:hypothetical protein
MTKQILRIPTLSAAAVFGLGEGRPGSVELIKYSHGDAFVELCVIEAETKQARTVLLDRDGLAQLEHAAHHLQHGM